MKIKVLRINESAKRRANTWVMVNEALQGAFELKDVVVINKINSAPPYNIQKVRENIAKVNPNAIVVDAASPIRVDNPDVIKGKRVLVIEDGPTLTHGEMKLGAGTVAAQRYGATELVDPRPYTVGRITETFKLWADIGTLLPATRYGEEQLKDLEATINKVNCDAVVVGTPIDLSRVVDIKKPNTRVYYDLQEIGRPNLGEVLSKFGKAQNLSMKEKANFSGNV